LKADKPLELAYPISDLEFSLFQGLIHRHSGIFLSEAKKPMLVLRLAPSGYLMLGQAECLSSHRDKLTPVAPSVYLHRVTQAVTFAAVTR
jgi:3-polyprenyl-4-hydroxybenzoate decarboxylase